MMNYIHNFYFQVLKRLKCFNTLQLVDKILTTMDGFYKRKILEIISGEQQELNHVQTFNIPDDCRTERNSQKKVSPNAKLLLCIFHVLQAVWRWLWDGHNGIRKDFRVPLFTPIKEAVYSEDPSHLTLSYILSKVEGVPEIPPNYTRYLEALLKRTSEWALYFRRSLPNCGKKTNNTAEVAMQVLKEKVSF